MSVSTQAGEYTGKAAVAATHYGRAMRAMHWTTLLLIVAIFGAAWLADSEFVGPYHRAVLTLHRSLGLTLWGLTLLRLAWRWRARIPILPADLPALQKVAARATEGLLYLFLLLQPALGLVHTNARGVLVDFWFLGELPAVVGRDRELARQAIFAHEWVALALLGLIGLHAAAALYHHFVRRDQVLDTMLPPRLRRRA